MRAAIDVHLKKKKAKSPTNVAGYARLIFDSLGAGHAGALRMLGRLGGQTFKRILMVGGGAKTGEAVHLHKPEAPGQTTSH